MTDRAGPPAGQVGLRTIGAGVALTLALAACGGGGGPGTAAGDTITVGVSHDQPGLGQQDGETVKGFEVDVATYVAAELGFAQDDIVFAEVPPPQRETAIQAGQVTLVVAAYPITDARRAQVTFAGPYFVAGQDLLVAAVDSEITGPAALNGRRLCSVTGSTAAERVRQQYASLVKLVELATYGACVEALVAGTVDAVTADNLVLAGFAAQPQYAGRLKVVGRPFSTTSYGVGLRKGDLELCTRVNAALERMVSDGSWRRALDANVGPSGFRVDTTTNPPPPVPCA